MNPNDHMPALHRAADAASLAGQSAYNRIFACDLAAVVVGALLSSLAQYAVGLGGDAGVVMVLRGCGCVLLLASVLMTAAVLKSGYKQRWYSGRAVAESAKSLAWRFAMRAEPFDGRDAESRSEFRRRLGDLLTVGSRYGVALDASYSSGSQVPSELLRCRSLPIHERMTVYLECRIADQRDWYSAKAATNSKWAERVLWAATGIQGLSFVAALAVLLGGTSLTLAGVLAAAATAALAWAQSKQFQELSSSYLMTAQELGLVQDQSSDVSTAHTLSVFVADAEAAISREHTMWLARRDSSSRLHTISPTSKV